MALAHPCIINFLPSFNDKLYWKNIIDTNIYPKFQNYTHSIPIVARSKNLVDKRIEKCRDYVRFLLTTSPNIKNHTHMENKKVSSCIVTIPLTIVTPDLKGKTYKILKPLLGDITHSLSY
jgi:hypothetical protein